MLLNNILALIADPIINKEATDSIGNEIKASASMLSSLSFDEIVQRIVNGAIDIGIRILIALIVFYIGKLIINKIHSIVKAVMLKHNIDKSLTTFVLSLVKITLLFILIVSVIGILGIETSSFIAIFASAGVAIGMALSGTLQNFAGGVLILFIKPYKIGDYIEFGSYQGTVKEIQIFNTVLNTPDNKSIIIPNGGLSTGITENYSKEETRRVDWVFGIAYGDSYDKAKEVIARLLNNDSRILTTPAYFIALNSLGDSSVNIVVRAWVKSPDYWDVFFDMNEKVYKTFTQENINIPFPQMDVHLKQD